jgi:hypothetical protein
MNAHGTFHSFFMGLALLLSVTSARADLTLVLTPAVQLGARSNEVVFTGVLSNTNPTNNLFLNDIQFSVDGAATNYLEGGSNTFFANVPGILLPGETYSDIVFAVAIDLSTPPGDYCGSVAVLGGSTIVSTCTLATQSFHVAVFDTPFDVWRFQQFGSNTNNPAISGESADPDGDGMVNLLEYAIHSNPNIASGTGLPIPEIDSANGCLTLIHTKVLATPDLLYTAEAAGAPGGPWSTNDVVTVVRTADNVTEAVGAADTGHPIADSTNRFMRLRVTRRP